MRNFMDLSRALKGLADAFHTIKLKLDGLYDSAGAIGNQFELIEEITLTEDVAVIERTTEPDSTPYKFKDVFITTEYANTAAAATSGRFQVNDIIFTTPQPLLAANNPTCNSILLLNTKGIFTCITHVGGASLSTSYAASYSQTAYILASDITAIKLFLATGNIEAGSVVKIYAVRA